MTNKQKYREFSKTEKNIPIFSKDWWLDSVCGDNNWDVVLVEKNNKIIATLPFYVKKRNILNIITMPQLTQYMGVYIKYHPDQKYERKLSYEIKILNELIDQLPKVDIFFQNFHYSITNWLPFYWKGYEQTVRYTYVIEDLTDLNQVFDNINSNYRNRIKKSQKLVEVKINMDIEDFYKINMMTFDRQNIEHPYSLEFLKTHDKYLFENNAREIFYAIDEKQQIHSALYLTWDNNSSYVHLAGENPELRRSSAGSLLLWEAIKYTKEVLKLNKIDFEGSMIEGVERVRRGFGAIQKPYFRISKINSRLLKIRYFLKSF